MATSTFKPTAKEGEHLSKAKDAGAQAWQKTQEAGGALAEAAEEVGADALGKVREAGSTAMGKAREAVASAGEMASEAASAVGKKADDLTAAAGHGIKSLGETISEKTPHEGITGHASQAVADTIRGAGRYVEEHKLSGIAHDAEQIIKNHPIPALLICFGIGVCVGRALKD